MVPMLTCGLVRSNFAFATVGPPVDCRAGTSLSEVLLSGAGVAPARCYWPVAFAESLLGPGPAPLLGRLGRPAMLTGPSPSRSPRLGPGPAPLLGRLGRPAMLTGPSPSR